MNSLILPNKVYDVMKWIFFLGVPLGTFIISIYDAVITGDFRAIVMAIGSGIAELAGIIIKISDSQYKKQLAGGEDNG